MDLINVASGYLPLSIEDVNRTVFTRVVNYDPLDQSIVTAKYIWMIRHLRMSDPALNVVTNEEQLDEACQDGNTNLVMAVSPYGFPVMGALLDRKLAPGAWVLLIGSSNNKYITMKWAFTQDTVGGYREATYYPGWIDVWAHRILGEYNSQTSGLVRPTVLNSFYVYQKKMQLF